MATKTYSIAFNASQPVLAFGYGANGATPAAVVIPSRRHSVRFPVVVAPPVPQTAVLTPSKDATLYQIADGSTANGAGIHIIAGATSSFFLRRALLAFDLASKIPAGSQITSVKLTMRVSNTITGNTSMELHRVTADWGEGASFAGTSRDGQGTAAKSGCSEGNEANAIRKNVGTRRRCSAGRSGRGVKLKRKGSLWKNPLL